MWVSCLRVSVVCQYGVGRESDDVCGVSVGCRYVVGRVVVGCWMCVGRVWVGCQ